MRLRYRIHAQPSEGWPAPILLSKVGRLPFNDDMQTRGLNRCLCNYNYTIPTHSCSENLLSLGADR